MMLYGEQYSVQVSAFMSQAFWENLSELFVTSESQGWSCRVELQGRVQEYGLGTKRQRKVEHSAEFSRTFRGF